MHTIMIKNNNDVIGFGYNDDGQLGLDHNISQNQPALIMQKILIRRIACGLSHTTVLTENNDVFVFGANHFG